MKLSLTMYCTRSLLLVIACWILPGLSAAWAQDALPPAEHVERAVPVIGRVWWAGKDLTDTQIRVYRDAAQKQFVAAFETGGASGYFVLSLEPGTYYMTAFSDQNGDQRPGPGDGIGFYGVTDIRSRPQPFHIDKGSAAMSMSIYIILQIAEDGRSLVPVAARALAPYSATDESEVSGTISGRFATDSACFAILMPLSTRLPPRAAPCAPDGTFKLSAIPGNYHIIAVENFNETHAIDTGDFIAVAGYEGGMGPSMPPVKVTEGKALNDLRLSLDWALAKDGRLRSGDGMVLGPRMNLGNLPAVLSGRVVRSGEPVANALVQVFGDEALTEVHYQATTDQNGRFCIGMRPGAYYVMAVLDRDGSGIGSEGDDIGYLSPDAQTGRPTAQNMGAGELRLNTDLALTLTVNADRSTTAIAPEPAPEP